MPEEDSPVTPQAIPEPPKPNILPRLWAQARAIWKQKRLVFYSFLQKLFHWKYSSIIIPGLWPFGWAMVGIAIAPFASEKFFWLTYAIFSAALIWSLGAWLTSKSVRKRNPKTWNRNEKKRNESSAVIKYRAHKWGGCLLIVCLFFVCVDFTRDIQSAKELSDLHGMLLPADDPSPINTCDAYGDYVGIFFGDTVSSIATKFPHTVFAVGGKSEFSMNRNRDGGLSITTDIFGRDGKIIVGIENNEFTVNPNNSYRMVRKDKHSLTVYDEFNNVAIDVRYINRHSIKILGTFNYPGVHIVSRPDYLQSQGGKLHNMCIWMDASEADLAF
jgi:hypothetical protein